jgi:hypothetical protein
MKGNLLTKEAQTALWAAPSFLKRRFAMKTLKTLVALLFISATLFSVTTSFAGLHVRDGSQGVYDCETDSFSK